MITVSNSFAHWNKKIDIKRYGNNLIVLPTTIFRSNDSESTGCDDSLVADALLISTDCKLPIFVQKEKSEVQKGCGTEES